MKNHRFLWWTLAATLATSMSCSGGAARGGQGGNDGAVSSVGDATFTGSSSDACPASHSGPILTAGACPATVTACQPGQDVCFSTALQATVPAALAACHIMCGELWVGTSGGCITTTATEIGLDPTQLACLRDYLFTHRFDCVPTDGWQRLYLGSCTLP